MILGGGGAVEFASWMMEKFDGSEIKMAVNEIKGKQTTINSLVH